LVTVARVSEEEKVIEPLVMASEDRTRPEVEVVYDDAGHRPHECESISAEDAVGLGQQVAQVLGKRRTEPSLGIGQDRLARRGPELMVRIAAFDDVAPHGQMLAGDRGSRGPGSVRTW
jgi:hypothetical protein